MQRKGLILLVLLNFLFINKGGSQTYVAPIIGLNFSKVKGYATDEYVFNDIYSDKGYNNRRFLYGVSLIQEFTDKITIKLTGNFSNRRVGYCDTGFVGFTDIKYDKYSFIAAPYYCVFGKLRIGLGISLVQLRNFEIGKEDLGFYDPLGKRYDQNQTGWITSMNYKLNPIVIEFSYSHSKSKIKPDHQFVNSISYFALQLSYPIKIINKVIPVKRQVICPKF